MSPTLLSGALVGLAISSVALGAPHLAIKRNAGSQVVTPCTSPFAPWNYVGCYNDQIHDPSTLPFDTFGPFDNMTVELCISSCKGNGYRYAGLEYYGSCYCGGAIQGPPADPSQCNAPCTGNASEICGGANTLSIWEDPTFPPVNPSTISDYVSLGCYTEASNNNRALIFQQNITSLTMSTEICLSSCKAMGMPYAGTEYSGECYCGTFLNPGSVPTTSDQCNMPCNGNPSETCGGSRILNLYYASDLVSSQPCGYVPPTGPTSEFTPTPIFGCLQQWQATNIVNAFLYLLANPTASNFNATANALLASDFTDTSDSINQLAGLPVRSPSFIPCSMISTIRLPAFHHLTRSAIHRKDPSLSPAKQPSSPDRALSPLSTSRPWISSAAATRLAGAGSPSAVRATTTRRSRALTSS